MKSQKIVRKASVAGSFYPAEKKELEELIDSFLKNAELVTAENDLKILIVPHAGLVFSGRTAGWGFKQIMSKEYTRVILLGVSHRVWFDYAAVFPQGEWETSLGKVEVDGDLAKALLDENQKILADTKPHQDEHSLEVELVFLQRVLKNFRIVPILLGQVSEELLDNLAKKISDNFTEKTLLVVSSDLSHYPSWSDASSIDKETIEAILSGEKKTFEKKLSELETKGYPNLETCACGAEAIKVALEVAKNLDLKDFKKIKYENSGDLPAEALAKAGVSGDKSRVVGYAAVGIWGKVEKSTSGNVLDEKAKKEALQIARKTLEGYLGGGKIPSINVQSELLNQKLGAFVTLRNKGQLRGCIGRFEPDEPLYKVIQQMAIAAATADTRFPPVSASELKEIKIEISVMTPKKKIDDWKKIELGKHGVVVQKGFRGGTFLPQVATETGWSKEEFLSELCTQKAGLSSDCYKDPSVNLFVFEAQVFEEK